MTKGLLCFSLECPSRWWWYQLLLGRGVVNGAGGWVQIYPSHCRDSGHVLYPPLHQPFINKFHMELRKPESEFPVGFFCDDLYWSSECMNLNLNREEFITVELHLVFLYWFWRIDWTLMPPGNVSQTVGFSFGDVIKIYNWNSFH